MFTTSYTIFPSYYNRGDLHGLLKAHSFFLNESSIHLYSCFPKGESLLYHVTILSSTCLFKNNAFNHSTLFLLVVLRWNHGCIFVGVGYLKYLCFPFMLSLSTDKQYSLCLLLCIMCVSLFPVNSFYIPISAKS